MTPPRCRQSSPALAFRNIQKPRLGTLVALGALTFVLSSCSTSRKAFDPTECNEQSANERGFTEGKEGREPDSGYSYSCREDLRAAVRKGYQAGYDKGRIEYKAQLAKEEREASRSQDEGLAAAPTPAEPPFHCSIQWHALNFEATGFTLDEARTKTVDQCTQSFSRPVCAPLPRCRRDSPQGNPRAFYCTVEVFGKKYDSFGSTLTETRSQLGRQCSQDRKDDFFCKEDKMRCKRNL